MKRLSAQDVSFLHLEDRVSHMHIGAIAVFEGPAPPIREFERMVEGHLPAVPRYRQRLRSVPYALGRPVWVDDPHFQIGFHIRHTALPRPGGDDELRRLVGRVMSQQLDRSRPLWEMWVIERLDQGRWALITKIHHAMVDGVSGAELLAAILDRERHPTPPPPDTWVPERQPAGAELAVRALVSRAMTPAHVARELRGAPRRLAAAAQGLGELREVLSVTPDSSLNGPLGTHRRWDWARSSLSDVAEIRAAFGGTVNDVVLAAVSGGFRALLESRGESTQGFVRSLIPVSIRAAEEHNRYDNRVSAMFADLPVDIADPVERLRALSVQMRHLKESHEVAAGDLLVEISNAVPAMLLSLGLQAAAHVPQHSVNTVATNVPGPQYPLYAAGRRMLDWYTYVPLAGELRVGVACFC
jgi:WS/DGAT/MGAT family acyltransferase